MAGEIRLEDGLSVEDPFSMREIPYSISFIHPADGLETTILALARIGPKILGHDTTSLVIPSREEKPAYYPKPEFTPDDVKKAVAASTLNSTSIDVLLSSIMEQREAKEKANCVFCYPIVEQRTPMPRLHHEGLYTPSGKPVISFPNINPFEPNHLLTVFADHATDLAELDYIDMKNYFLSGQQLAQKFRDEGRVGMVDFMNWGPDAAASVKHPHAQRGTIIEGMRSRYRQSRQADLFQSLNSSGTNPMEKMMGIIRDHYTKLFVFENEHIFVYVAFAPSYPDQTEVIFKKGGDLLDFSRSDLEIAAKSMLGVIHGLRRHRGVTDINLVLHQSDFNNGHNGYMMMAVINPRNKNKVGGIEIGQGVYVIPTLPEATAEALRKHYAG